MKQKKLLKLASDFFSLGKKEKRESADELEKIRQTLAKKENKLKQELKSAKTDEEKKRIKKKLEAVAVYRKKSDKIQKEID